MFFPDIFAEGWWCVFMLYSMLFWVWSLLLLALFYYVVSHDGNGKSLAKNPSPKIPPQGPIHSVDPRLVWVKQTIDLKLTDEKGQQIVSVFEKKTLKLLMFHHKTFLRWNLSKFLLFNTLQCLYAIGKEKMKIEAKAYRSQFMIIYNPWRPRSPTIILGCLKQC